MRFLCLICGLMPRSTFFLVLVRHHTIHKVKTKTLISCAVTVQGGVGGGSVGGERCSGRASDSESKRSCVQSQLNAACCVLEQDTLTPQSTG